MSVTGKEVFYVLNKELAYLSEKLSLYYEPINFGTEGMPDADSEGAAMMKAVYALSNILDTMTDVLDEVVNRVGRA